MMLPANLHEHGFKRAGSALGVNESTEPILRREYKSATSARKHHYLRFELLKFALFRCNSIAHRLNTQKFLLMQPYPFA